MKGLKLKKLQCGDYYYYLMDKSCCLELMIIIGLVCAVGSNAEFTSLYAFGDSLTDPGNNNYLPTLAKANYVPYGVDFLQGRPSGRFTNGKTCIDYLGEFIGLPLLPPYTSPSATGVNLLKGVNYASAAGGILEETGNNLGQRFSFSEQIQNFVETINEMKSILKEEELKEHLAKALVIIIIGSNDYINNYLQPIFYGTSFFYNPKDFADLLIARYATQVRGLESYGLKKFVLGGIGPLGCIPNQLATSLGSGKCVGVVNDMVGMFNERLLQLVDQLNSEQQHQGGGAAPVFVFGNTFGGFMDIIHNASAYGLGVTDRGCCGIGKNQGQITCLPFSVPCSDRNEYVFWDAFHPTQKIHKILAIRAYNGSTSDCYPFNIQQLAQI